MLRLGADGRSDGERSEGKGREGMKGSSGSSRGGKIGCKMSSLFESHCVVLGCEAWDRCVRLCLSPKRAQFPDRMGFFMGFFVARFEYTVYCIV